MNVADLGNRPRAVPWVGEGKIPWHDPAFSTRMLREHLSQEHDLASRRSEALDRHVRWLHDGVLGAAASRVLDLGCGPGLYAAGLARLGHACVGIDFSPASVAHARSVAEREALACAYRLEDLREADFGSGFDLVILLFGEINTFPPAVAADILARARRALSPGGVLVLEPHTEECVRSLGTQAPSWFIAEQGVFSDEPHLCLQENAWHAPLRAATQEFFVVSLESADVTRYVSTTQSWSDAEYAALLRGAGFAEIERRPSLTGDAEADDQGLCVLVARPEEGSEGA